MECDLDTPNRLENRHRKEKKELQAQIQALKKSAKNDKTKKKELIAEIIRLESELETKHQQELNSSESPVDQTEEVICATADNTKLKISKAQKRRDKKLQQDREREELIKLQEKENIHGPRNKEILTITTKLKESGLKMLSIPSDGDCLYKALSHQLALEKNQHLSVSDLRSKVSSYIRENKDDFMPFMSNPVTYDILSDVEFEDYCDKIRDTKVWGGQLEIRALSNLLKCPINVIQATGPEMIEQGSEFEGPALLITYHRHMYQLGEHYNSTLPIDDEKDELHLVT